jgi:hypothetical protein
MKNLLCPMATKNWLMTNCQDVISNIEKDVESNYYCVTFNREIHAHEFLCWGQRIEIAHRLEEINGTINQLN